MIETKRRSTILYVVLTAIILIIGFLFWPGKEKFNQSNPRDVNKNQIKIKVKALNIRQDPTVDSKDIGTVYLGEIFTVLEHIDKEDYYWYRIKTKQGTEGYIASDRSNEYVEVISGMVDREVPVITSKNEVLVFMEGEENYDEIECIDNYSKCTLTYDLTTKPGYAIITGIDEAENETTFEIKKYDAYSLSTLFIDDSENVSLTINKKESNNDFIINANYVLNKTIPSSDKSKTYKPIIDFFDKNFNEIESMHTNINKQQLGGICINDESNTLKDEYLKEDLLKGSILCMNYTFSNKNEDIKYIAIGFQSMENEDKESNVLSKYYSKYFAIR